VLADGVRLRRSLDFIAGRAPANKGLRYPADPPTVEEIIAVMRAAGEDAHGHRLRGLIVILGAADPVHDRFPALCNHRSWRGSGALGRPAHSRQRGLLCGPQRWPLMTRRSPQQR
jgi:hypothetical protein